MRQQAKTLFATQGYNGTSIDDLVKATGLLRGSLYKAFGSKRNLFEVVLAAEVKSFNPTPENLDLLTVALKDVAASDKAIRELCRSIVEAMGKSFPQVLGNNLLAKIGKD